MCYLNKLKACFPLQPYRNEMQRISLIREHYRVELMTSIQKKTLRYVTMQV